ncbi:MAG TPA: hypothetical protein VMZ28_24165 [Kofleriaceae bacterium]|nr:hypothetical protein [Kofleriaceae bacterium]
MQVPRRRCSAPWSAPTRCVGGFATGWPPHEPSRRRLELGCGAGHNASFLEAADGSRALRGVEWKWDPDPADDTFLVDYALLLRDGHEVRAVHDRHVEGIFTMATWLRVLGGAGYEVELVDRPFDDHETDLIFLCRRP